MSKLFRKKSNKKGFTLAELLIVVAIIAILVAIAIPIFTNALEEAQLRTNEANIRAVKAEAVTTILTNWEKESKEDSYSIPISAGAENGWYALAEVDKAGNIGNVNIIVIDGTHHTKPSATDAYKFTGILGKTMPDPVAASAISDKNAESATLVTSGTDSSLNDNLKSIKPGYVVQVYVTDIAPANLQNPST